LCCIVAATLGTAAAAEHLCFGTRFLADTAIRVAKFAGFAADIAAECAFAQACTVCNTSAAIAELISLAAGLRYTAGFASVFTVSNAMTDRRLACLVCFAADIAACWAIVRACI